VHFRFVREHGLHSVARQSLFAQQWIITRNGKLLSLYELTEAQLANWNAFLTGILLQLAITRGLTFAELNQSMAMIITRAFLDQIG